MSFLINNQVEFIHIPKTAGVWIEHTFHDWIKLVGNRHDTGKNSDLWSFCVAREPVQWLTSAFFYIRPRLDITSIRISSMKKKWIPQNWFPASQFTNIGKLLTLSDRKATVNDFIAEYLREMPGEYSRAVSEYTKNADRVLDFNRLRPQLLSMVEYRLKSHIVTKVKGRILEGEPRNVSKKPEVVTVDPKHVAALREEPFYENLKEVLK